MVGVVCVARAVRVARAFVLSVFAAAVGLALFVPRVMVVAVVILAPTVHIYVDVAAVGCGGAVV
eukprot:15480916-Alexandrium_andersonii.AAC.1